MSLFGAILPAVGSLIGGFMQNRESKRQFNADMDLAKNRHTYEVADLKNAGLNPILSANSGAVSLPAPTAGGMQNPFEKATQSLATARQLDVLKSQSRMLNSQADKNIADANLAKKTEDTQDWQRKLMDSEMSKMKVEESNLYSMISVNDASKQKILAEAELTTKKVRAFDSQLMAELNLKAAQTEQAVLAGKASIASASRDYAMTAQSYAQAGLLTQEQANALSRGEGIRIENAQKAYNLKKDKAAELIKTDPAFQNAVTMFGDVFGSAGNLFSGLRK